MDAVTSTPSSSRRARVPRYQSDGNGSGTAVTVKDMVLDHDSRIDDLESWQDELRGAMTLVKLTFGTSIVTALLVIAQYINAKPHP